jgi:hypothetical protein
MINMHRNRNKSKEKVVIIGMVVEILLRNLVRKIEIY